MMIAKQLVAMILLKFNGRYIMNKTSNSVGIDLSGILLVVFIVLKLTNTITWSWLTVILLPFGISLGLCLCFGLLAIAIVIIFEMLKKIVDKGKKL